MTTENILARVNEAINATNEQSSPRDILAALAADLTAQLHEECAKRGGVGSAQKTIQRMLDACKKGIRPALGYAWMDAAGRQCTCDGYRAYRLKKSLPLEDRPDSVGEGINLDKIFPSEATAQQFSRAPLPTPGELRAIIAENRAKNGKKSAPLYDFGPGCPVVDAQYLLDLLSVFPDAREIFLPYNITTPLYLVCDDGDAVLLPIRCQDNGERGNAAEARKMICNYRAACEKDANHTMSLNDLAALARVAVAPAA